MFYLVSFLMPVSISLSLCVSLFGAIIIVICICISCYLWNTLIRRVLNKIKKSVQYYVDAFDENAENSLWTICVKANNSKKKIHKTCGDGFWFSFNRNWTNNFNKLFIIFMKGISEIRVVYFVSIWSFVFALNMIKACKMTVMIWAKKSHDED